MYHREQGFSLIELLIVIAIVIMLVGYAFPNFDSTTRKARLTTGANDLVAALHLARTEATKRGGAVAVCRTDTSSANDLECGKGSSWRDGWLVFADDDGSGQINDDEELISVHPTLTQSIDVIDSDNSIRDIISYQANGFLALSDSGTRYLVFCDASKKDNQYSRVLALSSSGRPRIVERNYISDAPNCS